MSDRMTPVPFEKLMAIVIKDMEAGRGIFGVRFPYCHSGGALDFLGGRIETPCGPAAGPHTQLAQNIIAAYAGGARFFELKTVQTLDGPDLPVSKPCIDARDECYNVEWSTELRVPEAMDEYIKAWFALKLISAEYKLGSPDGFAFNMSVGYDYCGISSPKIDAFIEGLKNASATTIWNECVAWATDNASLFKNTGADIAGSISGHICNSITLSTLHGCPPEEIERIAAYLIKEKRLNTFVKCNPTLLGYDFARRTLDSLGFDYVSFDEHHFKEDLQYSDAVPMFKRLAALAAENGLSFGVKLTNTFPVDNPNDVMAGDEMYMSGRSLFPLTAEVARRLSADFGGALRISWSGGADIVNIRKLYECGIWPVTMATTLLKPGGYQRLKQIAQELASAGLQEYNGVDTDGMAKLARFALCDGWYAKPLKPAAPYKSDKKLPRLDCFTAPCKDGCPIGQDIPRYISLVGEGRYAEALRVILDKNPLPFITGTICPHRCMTECTRNFYEEPVVIRAVKLRAAETGIEEVIRDIRATPPKTEATAAVIGGGPTGLAAAYFLCRSGVKTTVFESSGVLGGVVRRIIPDFRITAAAVDMDVEIVRATGAEFVLNAEKRSVAELKALGYKYVIIATGAWKHGRLDVKGKQALDVFDFLEAVKSGLCTELGKSVAVIGGGNTAMDAARAAKRVSGVSCVRVIYRRTARYMPADEEELNLALEEGVEFRELLAPISHENGALSCAKMTLGEPDGSGRRAPVVTEETVSIPCDTLISAVGEAVDGEIFAANKIALDDRGLAKVSGALLTSVENVYAAGDARGGPATVVEAIADARRIADDIAKKEGIELKAPRRACSIEIGSALRKKGVLRFSSGASDAAERCLECSVVCGNCVDVCPNRANVFIDVPGAVAQIVHIDSLCNECGNCVPFCPWLGAPYKDKFTYFDTPCGFEESLNSGFLPLGKGRYRIRLDGAVFEASLDCGEVPCELSKLIAAFADRFMS